MMRVVAGLMLGFLVSGCVSTKNVPVNDAVTGDIHGKSITTAKREMPDFAAMTAGKAMFAVVGAVAMISAGNDIIRDNQVEDPANHISAALIAGLAEKHDLSVVNSDAILVANESPDKLAAQYASSDYLLDVRTINWSFAYFPTDWDSYRVMYSAKLRLINTGNGQIVAESFCARVPEKTAGAPSHNELLANQAQRLKDELRAAADYCVGEFKTKALRF
jgi:hypothetical protein